VRSGRRLKQAFAPNRAGPIRAFGEQATPRAMPWANGASKLPVPQGLIRHGG
jgi:hypothetical protein